jgi:hypothetical protein
MRGADMGENEPRSQRINLFAMDSDAVDDYKHKEAVRLRSSIRTSRGPATGGCCVRARVLHLLKRLPV